jgi:hypothetical protein
VSWPAPTVPSYRTAPTETSAPVITAPVPTGTTPTIIVPTIVPTSPHKLDGLHDGQPIGRMAHLACHRTSHRSLSSAVAICSGENHGCDEHELFTHTQSPPGL